MPEKISNHGLRMVEATLRASGVEDLEIEVLDLVDARPDDLLDEILEIDPDIVGFSAYLWSFPTFDRVARELRQQDASRVIVFGGPSARPAMLNLTPFHPLR
ncbi:MAG: cobalamin-dependent protein, partial [Pirellula sp.]